MSCGIYITANDRVIEQAIALLNSIRLQDSDIPVVLIPYDDNYQAIAKILQERYGVQLYPDLQFIDRLSNQLHQIFGENFFARPINLGNKLAGLAFLINSFISILISLFLRR
jgi:hypothetical protein